MSMVGASPVFANSRVEIKRPAENWMWGIVAVLFAYDMSLFVIQGEAAMIADFFATNMVIGLILMVGLFFRLTGRSERIATTLLAVAAFALFTFVVALANHSVLPLTRPLIDPILARWDATLGFHWPSALAFAAEYPTVTAIGKSIYNSTMFQVLLTTLALGFLGRTLHMERFVLSCMLGALITVGFWTVFPSFGPASLYDVPQDVLDAVMPVADPAYGRSLLEFAAAEQESLASIERRGLIAFPSFHTVLALLVPLALWSVPVLRWTAVMINTAMVPFIVIHGGHFVVDLFAGVVVALIAWFLAGRLAKEPRSTHGGSALNAT